LAAALGLSLILIKFLHDQNQLRGCGSGIVFATSSGENAMPQMDNLIALVAIGVGLAGTVAMWLLGILIANGFGWPG
jgi:hypothetical protein